MSEREAQAERGWDSSLPVFVEAKRDAILQSLKNLVTDASESQIRAWRDSIPELQGNSRSLLQQESAADRYAAILEYVMPMEARRADCVLLIDGAVVVVELKGKAEPTQADLDQVAGYARDLRSYHRDCADQLVQPVLVPTRMSGPPFDRQGITVCRPEHLERVVRTLQRKKQPPTPLPQFLEESAYRPLPTLVRAARELMQSGKLPRIHRAAAATEPTVQRIRDIAHEAAATKTRHLVLVTGVPGAGKTLVGLQTVHAHWLDDLAVPRAGGKPTAPAVFLSGNGPLVQVLQHELRKGEADGRTFVRPVKPFLERYGEKPTSVPPEHVLVFDEAQRAWDADQLQQKHKGATRPTKKKSEPQLFLEIAERIPDWCVVLGLVGSGQEIHTGEEGGLQQWRKAIEESPNRSKWTVHCPGATASALTSDQVLPLAEDVLNLTTELRFHLAKDVHAFVDGLLRGQPADALQGRAKSLETSGYHLRITRDLDVAKTYLRERYAEQLEKRFGLLASSRDKLLSASYGIGNDFQATKQVKIGPWYGDHEGQAGALSCRHLTICATEFQSQGLELDAVLLAWGSDYIRAADKDGIQVWSSKLARGYKRGGAPVRDPHQLRLNSYRVLLTRAREATVVFVPKHDQLDMTFDHLVAAGLQPL